MLTFRRPGTVVQATLGFGIAEHEGPCAIGRVSRSGLLQPLRMNACIRGFLCHPSNGFYSCCTDIMLRRAFPGVAAVACGAAGGFEVECWG